MWAYDGFSPDQTNKQTNKKIVSEPSEPKNVMERSNQRQQMNKYF
jgi:hypothetical protein